MEVIPGKRLESLTRSISGKSGKWLRHASKVSKMALRVIIAILASAKVE